MLLKILQKFVFVQNFLMALFHQAVTDPFNKHTLQHITCKLYNIKNNHPVINIAKLKYMFVFIWVKAAVNQFVFRMII